MEFQQRDSVLIDRARNLKKVFIVAFALIFAGCSKTEGLENIEKSFIEPTYAAVVTRERIAEKPSYEWITESAIKREAGETKEFLRQTHIYDSPTADVESDRTAYYFSAPEHAYKKSDTKDKWSKTEDAEKDDYEVVMGIFKNLKGLLEKIDESEEKENAPHIDSVYRVKEDPDKLSEMDEFFEKLKDNDSVSVEFAFAKAEDKYYIAKVTVEASKNDITQYTKEFVVGDFDSREHIETPLDLTKVLIKDNVKKFDVKEK